VVGYTSASKPIRPLSKKEHKVIILGIILAVVGYFTGLAILETLGAILVVVGVILWVLGAAGRPVAGRRAWY
jgi:hypothetical protein